MKWWLATVLLIGLGVLGLILDTAWICIVAIVAIAILGFVRAGQNYEHD